MKYCEFCGCAIEDKKVCTCEEAQAKAQKRKKLKLPCIIGAIFVLIVLVAVTAIGFLASRPVDPFDYVTVTFEGYSGQGVAILNFDKHTLISEVIGEEPIVGEEVEDLEKYFVWEAKYEAIDDGITYSLEPNELLKNGDAVVVNIQTNNEAAKHINSGSKEFTVKGLPELEKIDIFKDIDVIFDGVSGEANAKINQLSSTDILKACNFSIEPMYNLKNGDTVTVSITNADYLADEFGAAPSVYSCEYTVTGLGSYITSAEQIPLNVIEEIAEQYLQNIRQEKEDDSYSYFTYSEINYYGTYLFVEKEDAWLSKKNELHIFVSYDEYLNGEYRNTIYSPIVFYDVTVSAEGTVQIEYEDGSSSTFTTDMDDYLNKRNADYEVIKVD